MSETNDSAAAAPRAPTAPGGRRSRTNRRSLTVALTAAVAALGWLVCGPDPAVTPTPAPTPDRAPTPAPDPTPPPPESPAPSEYVERGPYPVGSRAVYFHDPARPFDSWNARHASEQYRALLGEIEAAGERQIVAAHLWYPAVDESGTRRATLDDFAASGSRFFRDAYTGGATAFLGGLANAAGAAPPPGDRPAVLAAARERLIRSLHEAPVADGRFPVLVAGHGLGGISAQWAGFAEILASRGYVVAAPSFLSDSSLPHVFESPDSRYAAEAGPEAVDRAYRAIRAEFKVIPGFYRYLFDSGGSSGRRAIPGGERRVGAMMAELFTQRVDDVETIIEGLASLDADEPTCLADYAARRQPLEGSAVCGLFEGAFDAERVGVFGHSLGSITAQFAVARLDSVLAAVGYNNGSPRSWEPPGIFGSGLAADGQPAGSAEPVLQIHGTEDAFVQNIFRGLLWNELLAAGGDPEEMWLLEPERALPSAENPQPIARNAYDRATGDRMIVAVKDLNHDQLGDTFAALFPPSDPITVGGEEYWISARPGTRKAVGEAVLDPSFRGERFTPLDHGTVGSTEVHLPTFLRNYYTLNWFDAYLRDDATARDRVTLDPIPEQNLLDLRSDLRPR